MALKIRMARYGAKKRPFYWIVVADARAPRDGKFIEKLGTHNPLLTHENPSRVVMNIERIKYWLSVGAKPSDRLTKFFSKEGLVANPMTPAQTKKDQPRKKAQERLKEEAQRAIDAEEAAKKAAEAEAQAAAEAAAAPVVEEIVEEVVEETPAAEESAPEMEIEAELEPETPASESEEPTSEPEVSEPEAETPTPDEPKPEDSQE
jgi:small subunit ribosomal protein S16